MTEERKPSLYLSGIFIDMVEINNWYKDMVKDTEPFNKKKLLGLF